MTRESFIFGLLLGLLLGFSVSVQAHGTRGFKRSGDAVQTYQPDVPLYSAVIACPPMIDLSAEASIGACGTILFTDGTHDCEGHVAIMLSGGKRCIFGVEP